MVPGAQRPAPASWFSEVSTNDAVWTVMDAQGSEGASLCRALPVGVDVTARQPCHMPASPGLPSGGQDTPEQMAHCCHQASVLGPEGQALTLGPRWSVD